MKTILTLMMSGLLVVLATSCNSTDKTTSDAPNTTEKTGNVPTVSETGAAQNDAMSKVRKDQVNSDIRAREQRNNVTGGDTDRSDKDLSSEVRSKLEANIPNGNLTITAKAGAVVVSGTVDKQEQLAKIEPLAKEIKGVMTVNNAVKVAPAMPDKAK
jgi:hyperosmotically inducible protein